MRTNIVLDETLVLKATTLTGALSKRELIRSHRKKNLFDLAGKIQLTDNYDHKALRELRYDSD